MAETADTPENVPPAEGQNQRRRIFKAAGWLAIGQMLAQIFALASSLVLTRLLTPNDYGIMELVYVYYTGLHMFSDLGLAQNIVQSPRGDEPRFLNTAWTVQLLRGGLLFVATWFIGPVVAYFDGNPELALLIPAVGLTALIEASESMGVHTASRHLNLHKVTLIQIGSRFLTVITQVAVALVWPSPWALVIGAWVGVSTIAIASHIFLSTHPHRLEWDRSAVKEVLSFGGWIFGSTVLTFFYNQGDRLILNALVSKSQLGVYGIALRLRAVIQNVQGQLVRNILMPVLAERNRSLLDGNEDERMDELSRVYYRARLRLDAVFVTSAGVLMTFGYTLIVIMYPPDFHLAGRILQVLSVQIAMMAALGSTEAILTGLGHTKHYFLQSIGRVLVVGLGIPLGWYFAGFWGLVWAVTLVELPAAFVLLGQMRKLGLLRIHREALALVFLAAGAAIGWILTLAAQYLLGV